MHSLTRASAPLDLASITKEPVFGGAGADHWGRCIIQTQLFRTCPYHKPMRYKSFMSTQNNCSLVPKRLHPTTMNSRLLFTKHLAHKRHSSTHVYHMYLQPFCKAESPFDLANVPD
jgi:hypothetical protein